MLPWSPTWPGWGWETVPKVIPQRLLHPDVSAEVTPGKEHLNLVDIMGGLATARDTVKTWWRRGVNKGLTPGQPAEFLTFPRRNLRIQAAGTREAWPRHLLPAPCGREQALACVRFFPAG